MFGLGIQELLILLAIIVIIFGARRLPQLGSSLGRGITNFKKSLSAGDENTISAGDKKSV